MTNIPMAKGQELDETEYSIPAMQELREEVQTKINEFQRLKEDLDYTIADIHNYWSTAEGAENAYNTLFTQYKNYSASLEEGKNQMEAYAKMIDEQIQRYGGAEKESEATYAS